MSAARQAAISQLNTQILTADQLLAMQSGRGIPPDLTTIPGTIESVESQVQTQKRQETEQRDRERTLASQLAQQARLQQQRAQRQGQQFLHAIRNGAKQTTFTVEKVPTPGGIAVPLVILLLLFMVLIPVNGHTRITWLWFSIIGHAKFTNAPPPDTSGSSGASGTGTPPPSPFPPLGPPVTPPQPLPPGTPPIAPFISYGDIMSRVGD